MGRREIPRTAGVGLSGTVVVECLVLLSSRRYSIVLADRTTGVVRRFTVSLKPTLIVASVLASLPILMGLGARWSAQATIADLHRENAALHQENANYREATGELVAQVASLQGAVDELGVRATVDPAANVAMEKLPPAVRSRAMGGGSSASAAGPVLESAFTSPDNAIGVLREVLGVIEDKLASVRSGVERRQALASATPSIWPVAGWLSSSYGNRQDPFNGGRDFHPGLDISAGYGRPVVATADGTVVSAGNGGAYGNLIVIDHGFGLSTRYGHLSRFAVSAGQHVRRGDVIAYVGSTGRSTSAHLHYEILVNGRLTNPLNLLARP
jgi:murein DD-endopeptidase MepM/ murein hydrolase activator NlpD